MTPIADYIAEAVRIVASAGPIALRFFRSPMQIQDKRSRDEYDPVTEADKAIEQHIRDALASAFPNHGICGEEHAQREGSSDFSWIIDPIDGTRAFISGMTAWGIMLGLRYRGRPVGGVIHQPYTGETFVADGVSAQCIRASDSHTMRTSHCASLGDAVLYCTHPSVFRSAAELDAFEQLAQQTRMMRYGGDCYAYCLLALGTIDLIVESGLEAYDVQPLIPLIEAAGGIITNRTGHAAEQGGFIVAAASSALHQQALAVLNS